jgi:hypothetical protein
MREQTRCADRPYVRLLRGDLRHEAHLLFTFVSELVHHPAVLDAVETRMARPALL